jgi:hypothetical protein
MAAMAAMAAAAMADDRDDDSGSGGAHGARDCGRRQRSSDKSSTYRCAAARCGRLFLGCGREAVRGGVGLGQRWVCGRAL